jgi:hypothetical protein
VVAAKVDEDLEEVKKKFTQTTEVQVRPHRPPPTF